MRNPVLKAACAVVLWLPALLAQAGAGAGPNVATLEQQVQKHLQEQKPQLAIPLLRQIVSLDEKNVNAQANLGVLLFFQNQYGEAIPRLRAAMELQPDLWRIAALLGIAEKRTGDLTRAENDLERAYTNLPDPKIRIETGLELMELYAASSEFEKALAISLKLEGLAPGNPQVLFAAFELSKQMMNHSLLGMMMTAPESAEMHLLMAGELGRQGDRVNAIKQYREAIRLNPKLPGAHFELGEQLRSSPDPALNAQAEAEYRAALQVNPYDELSWRQLGVVLSAKGDSQEAENDFRKALALQPKDSEAKTGLATVLISQNQSSEAISLLESAVSDDPSNTAAHYRLSQLYQRAGRTADSDRELHAFQHYKEVKDRLGQVFKQLAGPAGPM